MTTTILTTDHYQDARDAAYNAGNVDKMVFAPHENGIRIRGSLTAINAARDAIADALPDYITVHAVEYVPGPEHPMYVITPETTIYTKLRSILSALKATVA